MDAKLCNLGRNRLKTRRISKKHKKTWWSERIPRDSEVVGSKLTAVNSFSTVAIIIFGLGLFKPDIVAAPVRLVFL